MSEIVTKELSQEDRLKALFYQFVKLYERWAEDRQAAAKQGADMAELLQLFQNQIKHFNELESSVRKQISVSVQKTISDTTQKISTDIKQSATESTQDIAKALERTVINAKQTLSDYQAEIKNSQWKTIGITVLTTVATCLLLVKFLMPAPTLPLTDQQLQDLYGGQMVRIIWPEISENEREHFLRLIKKIEHQKD